MHRRIRGFSLIEAMVVIAIMAILAGAALPLVVKTVNQQSMQTTQSSAQVAYQAIFGARDHATSNMLADFGYVPTNGSTLADLVRRPAVTVAWPTAGGGFTWGWNGPYWTGPTNVVAGVTVPADGWGRPFYLQNNAGWQVVSAGPDGNILTVADNIYYPVVAAPIGTCQLTLTVLNNRLVAATGTVTVTDRAGTNAVRVQTGAAYNWNLNAGVSVVVPLAGVTVNPGPTNITVTVTAGPTLTEVVNLLPGQNYSHTYNIY